MFKRVTPGERLRIPAEAWNGAMAAAEAWEPLARRGHADRPRATPGVSMNALDILAYNNTAIDLPCWSVVRVWPSSMRRYNGVCSGMDPFHEGPIPYLFKPSLWEPPDDFDMPIAVTQQPITASGIGLVRVAGASPCYLTYAEYPIDPLSVWAQPIPGDTTAMRVSKRMSSGSRVLVHGTVGGTQGDGLGVVLLGEFGSPVLWGKATANATIGAECTVTVNPCDPMNGFNPDATQTMTVYLPRYTPGEDPLVRTDQVIPFWRCRADDWGFIAAVNLCDGKIGKTIRLWNGNAATVPGGWQICDGTNGTPDLRDRFIRGAETPGPGGLATHTHEVNAAQAASGTDFLALTGISAATVTPPYYALAFIMRVQ